MRLLTDGGEAGIALFGLIQLDGGKLTQNANPRSGSYNFRVTNTEPNSTWQKVFANLKTELYARCPFSVSAWTSELNTDHAILAWFNESTKLGRVRLKGINTGLYRIDILIGEVIKATSVDVIELNSYAAAEVKVLIDGTEGEISVLIDGQIVVSYSGDTTFSGKIDINKVQFGGAPPHVSTTIYLDFDDLAINDGEGGIDDSWCNDAKIIGRVPTGDGTYSEWESEPAGPLWSTVDEIPPNASDYIYAEDAGLVASFTKGPLGLPTSAEIQRIVLSVYAAEMTEATGIIKFFMRKSTTDFISTVEQELTSSFAIFAEEFSASPFTYGLWTEAEFNSIEIGVST